ncbi:MAG: hypothetical protein COV65_04730, partial [Nitrosopumilales archaeon CG11_big_fil_rev_8_21_14_0_20_33_24]
MGVIYLSKLASLFIFTILVISLFSFTTPYPVVSAESIILNEQNKLSEEKEFQSTNPIINNHYTITLNESLNIKFNDLKNDNLKNSVIQKAKITSSKEIILSENISINTKEFGNDLILSLKSQSERNAIMERILENNNPIRIQNINHDKPRPSLNNFDENKVIDDNTVYNFFNVNPLETFLLFHDDQFSSNDYVFNDIQIISNLQSYDVNDSLFSLDSPIILIFSLPIVGYIFLKTENKNLAYKDLRHFSCFFFIILLSSTAVVTPLSISSSYWGTAYAEEISFDEVIQDSVNDVILINSTSNIIESDSNSTEPIISNSTEPIISNSTEPIISNSTEPVIPKIIVPEATVTFQFDESTIESNSTEPNSLILELDGQDNFVQIQNVTVTDDVDGLTVTAWVKPEFSSGSSEFTVVSKDKSFSLTISNNIQSENTAKFSVFDGIKWTSVESTSTITEDWSFLSSTFSGEHIAIFVNGTKEATNDVIGIPTLVANGQLEVTPVEKISSKEDIVIGATVVIKEDKIKSNNKFSGKLDNISLYDYVLDDEQIFAMYEQTKDIYAAMVAPELTVEEIIAQMELELLANTLNSTVIPTNSTVIPT